EGHRPLSPLIYDFCPLISVLCPLRKYNPSKAPTPPPPARPAPGSHPVPLLFAVTLFVSASLLFMVQPMVGKMVLPLLGGSPAVWNACMVFFQALLLLGYLYAHHVSTKYPPRRQWALHLIVLAVPVFAM